jgi:predicted O-methyltransferase YrrM
MRNDNDIGFYTHLHVLHAYFMTTFSLWTMVRMAVTLPMIIITILFNFSVGLNIVHADRGHEACISAQNIHVDVIVDGHPKVFSTSWQTMKDSEMSVNASASAFCQSVHVHSHECPSMIREHAHAKLHDLSQLSDYLFCRGHVHAEGHIAMFPVATDILRTLVSDHNTIRRVLQIGFNAGHSSHIMLRANPHVHVTSFDLMEHAYAKKAADFLDVLFPGRHTLIPGDSTITVPAFLNHHHNASLSSSSTIHATFFDLIFIDGGHTYEVASADLRHCRDLAKAGTIVVMDDVVASSHQSEWTDGPTRAWNEAIAAGIVVELGRVESMKGSPTKNNALMELGQDGIAFGFYTGHAASLLDPTRYT